MIVGLILGLLAAVLLVLAYVLTKTSLVTNALIGVLARRLQLVQERVDAQGRKIPHKEARSGGQHGDSSSGGGLSTVPAVMNCSWNTPSVLAAGQRAGRRQLKYDHMAGATALAPTLLPYLWRGG
jgi:predicted lipid-binding transport protein (Tim44 family)